MKQKEKDKSNRPSNPEQSIRTKNSSSYVKMPEYEQRIIDWCIEKKELLFFLIVNILLSLLVRYAGRNMISNDLDVFLLPWYQKIKEGGGLQALNQQVGNYNILYQTLIACMTYVEGNAIHLYKLISILFDYVLAFSFAVFLCRLRKEKWFGITFQTAFAAVIFLPTVVLNSAYWGQCDSIYVCFVILALSCLYQEKYTQTFVFYGLAIACKLQAVFILPFLICYYIYKKRFSFLMFFISLGTFWLTGLPAFLCGRGLLEPFRIYLSQAKTYREMWMNVSSFWIVVGNDYNALRYYAILLTIVLLGLALYLLLTNKKSIKTPEQFLNTAAWMVWTCILFLPAMHERYTYLLDLLLLLLCFFNRNYIKYAAVSILLSTITYGAYLFGSTGIGLWHVLIYVSMWLHYTCYIVKQDNQKMKPLESVQTAERR